MTKLTEKSHLDYLAQGLKVEIKALVVDEIVAEMVAVFKSEIQEVVAEKISGMVFDMAGRMNHRELREELCVVIEWAEARKEKTIHKMTSEIVEGK